MRGLVEHHAGELFPRVGFIATNLTLPSRALVRFYNKRGTAEVAAGTIKEGKQESSRQGCESGGVRVPVPSITCFGRLAYPGHAEATKLDVPRRRSLGCPAAVGAAVGTIGEVSKLGGLNIKKKCLQPRKTLRAKSCFAGESGKPTHTPVGEGRRHGGRNRYGHSVGPPW